MKKALIILSVIISLSGCTLKYSFTGASIPPEAKTVSVADFPNMAPLVNPLLSQQLTEALKDRFVAETSLQLVRFNGDLNFEGTIVKYETRPIAIQAESDEAQQNRLTIAIKVKYTNIMEPKSNYEATFSRFQNYDSSFSLEEVESALITLIIEELVDDMYNKAVVNW
jgi:hypothetical protein